jgi:hypothetical protein
MSVRSIIREQLDEYAAGMPASFDVHGDLGIEAVAGVTDGGGNKVSGNGNPLQCTNVFCG